MMEATVTGQGRHIPHQPGPPPGRHHRPPGEPNHRQPRQASAPPHPPSAPPDPKVVAAELRNQVADRMRAMSMRHAEQAWQRHHDGDPIAPHALAYFYVDTNTDEHLRFPWRVRTATRLFLDIPQARELPQLLYVQARLADGYRRAGQLDPRTQLATNRREQMTPAARYFGVGVSTLDTPQHPWSEQRWSGSHFEVSGRGFALLADSTWLLLERSALAEDSEPLKVWSSQTLDGHPGQSMRRWHWGRHLPELADPQTRDIWLNLGALHRVIAGAGHGR